MSDEPPQLYLVTPPGPDPDSFLPVLDAVLDTAAVACVLLLPGDLDDAALRRVAERLRDSVQGRDIAFLVDGRPDLAVALALDGVHTCPAGPPVKACRATVGRDAIVGYSCRNSRHAAMEAGEAGADYIVFGNLASTPEETAETLEHLRWWSEMMEIPSVALDRIDAGNAATFAETGADFLAIGPALWEAEDPASAFRAIAERLGLRT
ncbi:MAG: thiamine phosphate synthase [Azospirillaceae bacterium]